MRLSKIKTKEIRYVVWKYRLKRFLPHILTLFLAVIALLPHIYGAATGMGNMAIGGTSIIIIVGVALETVKQLESQMMMRHYKGFLE